MTAVLRERCRVGDRRTRGRVAPVADLVAPRRDGGSWFGVLCDFMIGDGDGDGGE